MSSGKRGDVEPGHRAFELSPDLRETVDLITI
jgi:hypothetical protein